MNREMEPVEHCVTNNVDLYNAVFGAHGRAHSQSASTWSSDEPAPMFYSYVLTMCKDDTDSQLAEIKRLKGTLKGQFAVKDGFSQLDLSKLGFSQLFPSTWIYAEHSDINVAKEQSSTWVRVSDPAGLERWEEAWKKGGNETDQRIFAPAILSDKNVAFFGRLASNGFDAGCIANKSLEVVGISNIFQLDGAAPASQEAVGIAASAFGDFPLVGYENGDSLDEMLKYGFKGVGELKIWLLDS